MKTCRSCQVEQPRHCFHDSNTSCVSCHNTYNKIHQKDDIVFELTTKQKEEWRVWNYRNDNRHKIRALSAKYRARKLQATPLWLTTAQIFEIESVYKESIQLEHQTGTPHHVDHIIPLQGENVCGLHVPWNLRAIPAKENLSKSNSLQV